MFDDYFDTLDYLEHKTNQLSKREILLSIDKKIKSKEKTSQNLRNLIKKEFNQTFLKRQRKAFSSQVYVKISLYYNDSNPPTAVKATKNLLDLMHVNKNQKEARENIGIKRDRLPFYDDSQISFLSVRQHLNTSAEKAQAYISIENFNNILQYADLLYNFKDKLDSDDYENSRSEDIDYEERIFYPKDSLGYRIEMYRRQKQLLAINEISPFYLQLLHNNKAYRRDKAHFMDLLEGMLKWPIRVNIPISHATKDIKKIKRHFKDRLSRFKNEFPYLASLYGPIILSVYYKPSQRYNVKDVDNFIREIVAPSFEEVFRPPINMFAPTKDELRAAKDMDYNENLNDHIIGYDIIKLPNNNDQKGYCIIGFHMEQFSDIVSLIKDRIEKILER